MRPSPADDGGAAGHGAGTPRARGDLERLGGARFGRMFEHLPRPDPGPEAIDELVRLIELRSKAHSQNAAIPSGYTYLGQFVDHDITFDATSKLERNNDPDALVNFRTPRYDLDSLYGSGPDDEPYLYEWAERRDRGVKLLVGRGGGAPGDADADLPRNEQGVALIGDARNDDNRIVSQLHLLFARFHNAVVDHLRGRPRPPEGRDLFEEARRLVRWHYQWIVAHDYLERIAGAGLAHDVLRPAAAPGEPATVSRRFYAWEGEPFIPVEFSAAAFRFGHSMVRSAYFMQAGKPAITLFPHGAAAASVHDLAGSRPLPADLAIDWELFFFEPPDPQADEHGANNSLRINNRIALELFAVPERGVLPRLNLQRGRALGLPCGRDVAEAMEQAPLEDDDLQLDPADRAGVNEALRAATPLWYYVLCEANARAGGRHLGPAGGRIVAEVLVGLLEADPESYLAVDPAWRPTLPARRTGTFTMLDLMDVALGRAPG